MPGADVIDISARRHRSASEAAGDEVFEDLLRMIGEQPDPVAAALAVIAGFARFVASQGVGAQEVARLVAWHMAQPLDEDGGG